MASLKEKAGVEVGEEKWQQTSAILRNNTSGKKPVEIKKVGGWTDGGCLLRSEDGTYVNWL